jgi:hypothetical protein
LFTTVLLNYLAAMQADDTAPIEAGLVFVNPSWLVTRSLNGRNLVTRQINRMNRGFARTASVFVAERAYDEQAVFNQRRGVKIGRRENFCRVV